MRVDYGHGDEDVLKRNALASQGSQKDACKLDARVQELIRLLFDVR